MTRIKDKSKKQLNIKHTGKSEPKVDPKKVAEGLGAEVTVNLLGPKGTLRVTWYKKDGSREVRLIFSLWREKDLKNCVSLGTVEGQDLFHCLNIAARHVENFWEKVCGYRYVAPTSFMRLYVVEFYGKKEKSDSGGK